MSRARVLAALAEWLDVFRLRYSQPSDGRWRPARAHSPRPDWFCAEEVKPAWLGAHA